MGSVVPVVVMPLVDLTGVAAQMPVSALSDYFGALGFPLQFRAAQPLTEDPTDHPDEVDEFCRSQAPQGPLPWPGVLVVGDMSVDGPSTNGILLDLDRRGACAIFTQSFAFLQGTEDTRFEIYAHEIGHMLNLSHADARDPFPTAMNQWDARASVHDRRAVWRQAISNGSVLQGTRLRTFFGNGSRHPVGLPMSAICCAWLNGPNLGAILPWASQFKDSTDDGAQDASCGMIECRMEVRGTGSVAQPVDLQVQISPAPGQESVDIPAALDLRSGLIEIHVTTPAGITRKYRTRSRTCGTSRQRLERGRTLRRNYSLLSDSGGLLFPVAGTYKLEAVLPTLGVRSGAISFVVDSAVDPFADVAFQSFLAKDLPADDSAGWRAVDEVLQSRAIPSATKAFLRSKAAARNRRPFVPIDQLKQEASPRVQERDVLLRVIRMSRNRVDDPSPLYHVIDQAEEVLRATDSSNPSIQYLEHVRRRAADIRRGKEER